MKDIENYYQQAKRVTQLFLSLSDPYKLTLFLQLFPFATLLWVLHNTALTDTHSLQKSDFSLYSGLSDFRENVIADIISYCFCSKK